MLKKRAIKKILITTSVMFTILLLCMIPNKDDVEVVQKLEYSNHLKNNTSVFLIDKNNFVAKTKVEIDDKDITKRLIKKLEILITGKSDSKIPNGFTAIIPQDTEIISLEVVNKIVKVNFSKELLNIKKEKEEKLIEAIVYTLTDENNIEGVIIYVDGNILTQLPYSKMKLPATLDRSYGINKEYDLTSYNNIEHVTLYYLNKNGNDLYYVPVTRYMNNINNKENTIVKELSKGFYDRNNMMSYLNYNAKLLNSNNDENVLTLVFNKYIFDDIDTYSISNEVVNTISFSIADSMNIKEVIFKYNDKEICKSVIKSIE